MSYVKYDLELYVLYIEDFKMVDRLKSQDKFNGVQRVGRRHSDLQ